MTIVFKNFDLSGFWDNHDYALNNYVGDHPTDLQIDEVQTELGYHLPQSYIEMMKVQNGGTPKHKSHITNTRTSWASNHIAIDGIYGIGRKRPNSLCGLFGSKHWIDEWRYPAIGIYFADCPSAGHDMLCLDCRNCGSNGEPEVVHVDQEWDYAITAVAENFETFIRGLKDESNFDDGAPEPGINPDDVINVWVDPKFKPEF